MRLVLFDFDFTLADPTPWLIPAWVEALAAIGYPPPDTAALTSVIGRTLATQFRQIVAQPASGPTFETFRRAYTSYRDAHAPAQTRFFPDVVPTLEALRASGHTLGIVSTGTPSRLHAILERAGLHDRFERVIAGAADKTTGILDAMKALNAAPANTTYIGDHPDDATFASRAGVGFIAILRGIHEPADFPPGTRTITHLSAVL